MVHIIAKDIIFISSVHLIFSLFIYLFNCVTLSEFCITHYIIFVIIVMYDIIIYCFVKNFPKVKFICMGSVTSRLICIFVWFANSISLSLICDSLVAVCRESRLFVSQRREFVNVYIYWSKRCRVINILNFSLIKSFHLFLWCTLHLVSIIISHIVNICVL